ncbi:MAG: type II toxin-antitoxin system HicA family toxin [Youngiibacter sp.]|nr:type II toxin-antitoxin system HicA family toxin [Youngiibacter sp.]
MGKLLKKHGWELVRIDGSQHTYKHADSAEIITIIHPVRDYAPGTLDKILKQMGLK